jgi:hypothetical protein
VGRLPRGARFFFFSFSRRGAKCLIRHWPCDRRAGRAVRGNRKPLDRNCCSLTDRRFAFDVVNYIAAVLSKINFVVIAYHNVARLHVYSDDSDRRRVIRTRLFVVATFPSRVISSVSNTFFLLLSSQRHDNKIRTTP